MSCIPIPAGANYKSASLCSATNLHPLNRLFQEKRSTFWCGRFGCRSGSSSFLPLFSDTMMRKPVSRRLVIAKLAWTENRLPALAAAIDKVVRLYAREQSSRDNQLCHLTKIIGKVSGTVYFFIRYAVSIEKYIEEETSLRTKVVDKFSSKRSHEGRGLASIRFCLIFVFQ